MKNGWVQFILAFMFMVISGFGAEQASARDVLNIMAWETYHPPEIVARFQKETGIKVRFEIFDSSEDMEAILAQRDNHFDLAMPREYSIATLAQAGLLAKFDHRLMPNLANLDSRYINTEHDPGCQYSIPYMVGTMGIMYRLGPNRPPVDSWAEMVNSDVPAPTYALLNSYRESMGIALKYMGKSFNSQDPADIEKAANLLMGINNRPSFLGYLDYAYAQKRLVAGTVDDIVTYNSEAAIIIKDDPRYGFVVPKEGSLLWADSYVINRYSKNIPQAHKWLNFLLDPEVAAIIADWTMYTSPNQAARRLISPENINNKIIYPADEVMETLEFSHELSLEAKKRYQEAWSRVYRP